MDDSIPCLLDTNSIVKNYHTESGSNIIQYLFEKSPTAQINIIDLHIPEVVSVFHLVHKRGEITADARDKAEDTFLKDILNKKIMPYVFKNEHLPILFSNFHISYKIDPPPTKRIIYIPFLRGYAKELKDIAGATDIAMLTIMQQIQSRVGESYLFSSDGHVIEIAKAMKLPICNPEKMTYDDIPDSLNRRRSLRKDMNLRVKCQEPETCTNILSTNTIDLSFSGACINYNKKVDVGKKMVLKICDQEDKNFEADQSAEVVWADQGAKKIGVKFLEPITAAKFYM